MAIQAAARDGAADVFDGPLGALDLFTGAASGRNDEQNTVDERGDLGKVERRVHGRAVKKEVIE